MSWHVVWSLGGVSKPRCVLGHQSDEIFVQIQDHIRIGIFLNGQGRRRVTTIKR